MKPRIIFLFGIGKPSGMGNCVSGLNDVDIMI
jgi:hypothetical protein